MFLQDLPECGIIDHALNEYTILLLEFIPTGIIMYSRQKCATFPFVLIHLTEISDFSNLLRNIWTILSDTGFGFECTCAEPGVGLGDPCGPLPTQQILPSALFIHLLSHWSFGLYKCCFSFEYFFWACLA